MNQETISPRGRWYQFRLRTLSLLMLIAGPVLYCSYLFGPSLYYELFPPETTLPSTYYLKEEVQYFAAGPEFKLTSEAEVLKAAQTPKTNR